MHRNLPVVLKRLLAVCLALLSAHTALAAPITFIGASGSLAASATFDTSGSNLVITMTNTSTADVLIQPHILCAMFFDVSGAALTLTPATGSAVLAPGSTVLFDTAPAGGVVGGEWSYLTGIGGSTPNSANYGISSAGYGIFGGANFPGPDLDNPPAVNGVNYGITSAGDNPATGQTAVTGSNPLIKNSVVYTLPGLPVNFDPSTRISNVLWQYGTALTPTDPALVGIVLPEPAALSLLGVSAFGVLRRRPRRA